MFVNLRMEIMQKMEPIPYACSLSVNRFGKGWFISVCAKYGGYEWYESEFILDTDLMWVSAIRDKILTRHWRRAKSVFDAPYEVGGLYWAFYPYSKMEQLNRLCF